MFNMPRILTSREIEILSSRKGVRKIAVQNFLGNFEGMTQSGVLTNLRADARSYSWNSPTVNAISAGVRACFDGKPIPEPKVKA